MATGVDYAVLLAILVLNAAIAAIMTRLFRVRLATRWGPIVFALVLVPVVQAVVTLALGSLAGPNLGSAGAVVGLLVLLPLTAGIAFDYFWMPAPEEVELPATGE